jgi:uncharacterized protein YbjT (DUF2867 family)
MSDGAVLLAGATGLVGSRVLARLLAGPDGPRVIAPVRRPLPAAARLDTPVTGFAPGDDAALEGRIAALAPGLDAYVCCLGTTIRSAGSREAFVAVDRELVLRLAAIARARGAAHAVLVSSVGASAQSGNFYLRVKGEAERGLAALGFRRIDILRPGLLLGDRSEWRPGERLARTLAPAFNPLLRGRLARYRAIPADEVAAAAVALLAQDSDGVFVHEHASLHGLASLVG